MSQRNSYVYRNLGNRIAEEIQLLAEEKWIIDALTKIKTQRNCLQIERLHLESLKAKLNTSDEKPGPTEETPNISMSMAVDMMKAANNSCAFQNGASVANSSSTFQNGVLDEALCNEEELNLTVTNPVLSTHANMQSFNMEEEEDEEEMDCEDMVLDMDMFMKLKS